MPASRIWYHLLCGEMIGCDNTNCNACFCFTGIICSSIYEGNTRFDPYFYNIWEIHCTRYTGCLRFHFSQLDWIVYNRKFSKLHDLESRAVCSSSCTIISSYLFGNSKRLSILYKTANCRQYFHIGQSSKFNFFTTFFKHCINIFLAIMIFLTVELKFFFKYRSKLGDRLRIRWWSRNRS